MDNDNDPMRDLAARVEKLEAALKFYGDPSHWPNMPNPANPHYDMEMDAGTRARDALKALKRSQALDELVAISQEAGLYDDPVPDVPGAEEIFRQLAERQEPLGADFEAAIGDRSTLYETDVPGANEVETSAWTDDDQRGLNAAIADAMWHWDTRNEGPLDPDDAISLAESLKFHLQDNGFQIVRLATRAQGESS